jgi:hypothetical protein
VMLTPVALAAARVRVDGTRADCPSHDSKPLGTTRASLVGTAALGRDFVGWVFAVVSPVRSGGYRGAVGFSGGRSGGEMDAARWIESVFGVVAVVAVPGGVGRTLGRWGRGPPR